MHELATKDPLTQVANRAEFDRVLAMFVVMHLEQNRPCSMIMTDIDHFKTVNDTFGHQAGDEVLKFVARMLRNSCRAGDLVARYGGEEFVVLCTDCDNVAATRRAEEIRRNIAAHPHVVLRNESITVSCGVTEIQPGDTPATMLHRADRAMYMAKEQGRNSVVQLGTGFAPTASESPTADEPAPSFKSSESAKPVQPVTHGDSDDPALVATAELLAWLPPAVGVRKLHGFAADHHAEIVLNTPGNLQLRIGIDPSPPLRSSTVRPLPLSIDLQLNEESVPTDAASPCVRSAVSRTRVRVTIRAIETQPDRQIETGHTARRLIESLKAYLVAHDAATPG